MNKSQRLIGIVEETVDINLEPIAQELIKLIEKKEIDISFEDFMYEFCDGSSWNDNRVEEYTQQLYKKYPKHNKIVDKFIELAGEVSNNNVELGEREAERENRVIYKQIKSLEKQLGK